MAPKRRARRPRSDGSKVVGRNEGSDDDEQSGKTAKRLKKPHPAEELEKSGPLTDGSADAGHDKRAAAPKRSPPPDADTVAASAPRLKKNRRKKKKKKQLRKATPPPQEDEPHGREMPEHEPRNTSLPQGELREKQQEKKTEEQEHAVGTCDKDMHSAAHGQEQHADGAQLSPRLNLRSDPEPEPMGFWGVVVKPREPYAHDFSGCVRVTQATLGNLKSVGWTTITCAVGGRMPVCFCTLKSRSPRCKLDLEYGKGQNVVFSVIGDSSVHLAGYYKIPDAAANVQALVTQIQEAEDRETTHVHGTAQKHNALDAGVHNDGTNQMVGQAGLNAAANVQVLVTQSQEAADHKTIHAHDIARRRNALETEVHTDCTNQMVGHSGLNIMIPDAAAKEQALVTQSQAADGRETTNVHGTAQKHNALDAGVHNDGTNQMVEQAGLNAAANVQALVTQSQEAVDHKTIHAHEGRNAPETDVHNGGPNQMVGQSGLNMKISNEASLGSSNRPVDKDVGGPISDELKIDELESGDCNAEMASDGKEVKVKYTGMLEDGTVVDSSNGGPAIHTFTLGFGNVIAGWHQGIKGMRVGGKRKLTIPPGLGYGDIAQKEPQKEIPGEPEKVTIPANSWLVYDIELLEVSEPEPKPKKYRSVKHH